MGGAGRVGPATPYGLWAGIRAVLLVVPNTASMHQTVVRCTAWSSWRGAWGTDTPYMLWVGGWQPLHMGIDKGIRIPAYPHMRMDG